jgi:arabinofuranosyltransferase
MAPIVLVAVLATGKRWTFDDGFIYFRAVDQILAGNGPVFNVGERVESFTSPAWLALLTIGDVVSPLRLEYTAAALSIGCTALGMWLATLGSARLVKSDRPSSDRPLVPLGSVIFASLWPVWVWSTSGLEIGLTYAWLGACLLVLARWATGPRQRPPTNPSLVLLGLGWLIRPELALSSMAFVAVVVTPPGLRRSERVRAIAVAAALPLGYQIFRMGYYGLLVSSPAIAKEGMAANVGTGWFYLRDFLGPYLLVLPLLAVGVGVAAPFVGGLLHAGEVRPATVVIVFAATGCLHAAMIVMVGGDYLHGRLLLPALFAFLAPFFVVAATIRNLEVLVGVSVWATVSLLALRPPDESRRTVLGNGHSGSLMTYEDYGFRQRGADQPWIDGAGLYVAHEGGGGGGERTRIDLEHPDEIVVATYPLGAVGYALGPEVRVVDLYGLADPLTGHRRLDFRYIPGHEKSASGPWLVARLAHDPSLVPPNELDEIGGAFDQRHAGLDYLEQVAWAEAALRCPRIETLVSAYVEPLSTGQFLSNIWNAPANTSLRIPHLPEDAYREECSQSNPPAPVADFWSRPEFAAALSAMASPGDLVVVDNCAATYMATAQSADPWIPVDGATFRANVTFDAADTTPRLAVVWILRPFGDASAVVWAETDGNGRYRLRLDIDWFPPALQDWAPIPVGGLVEARLSPGLTAREWRLTSNGALVGVAPMASVDGHVRPIIPEAAGPSSTAGSIRIDHAPPEISDVCSRFAEAG